MLTEVEASCAEHGAVTSASPRDGSWQLQVHLLIARRTAQSDLTVRSDRVHASRSNGECYEDRVFTNARAGTVSVRPSAERTHRSLCASYNRVPDGI